VVSNIHPDPLHLLWRESQRLPETVLSFRSTILPYVVGRMTAKRKVAGSNLLTDNFSTCNPTYLRLWALWVPGEESWGRSDPRKADENQSLSHRIKSNQSTLAAKCRHNDLEDYSLLLILGLPPQPLNGLRMPALPSKPNLIISRPPADEMAPSAQALRGSKSPNFSTRWYQESMSNLFFPSNSTIHFSVRSLILPRPILPDPSIIRLLVFLAKVGALL
jgi:hypothetical protein